MYSPSASTLDTVTLTVRLAKSPKCVLPAEPDASVAHVRTGALVPRSWGEKASRWPSIKRECESNGQQMALVPAPVVLDGLSVTGSVHPSRPGNPSWLPPH
ncbi:hypothetical protein EYF80_026783 [Liparis tanakae]|uniref:Uncharacterized protein n=1 Tax=Liparis tanakae TaxID=230148 RepID=A0A4Z2HDK1_9TELE|nr:hypothetical protein EYF80_026783 [Liparis tanakae]